jgi:hypothetical protein
MRRKFIKRKQTKKPRQKGKKEGRMSKEKKKTQGKGTRIR